MINDYQIIFQQEQKQRKAVQPIVGSIYKLFYSFLEFTYILLFSNFLRVLF